MKNFYIITNSVKDPDLAVTNAISNYLELRGCRVYLAKVDPHKEIADGKAGYCSTDPSDIPDDVECIIVLGGDGTLVRAADDVVDRQIPLLGINLGTLGYLAEIDRASIFPALDALLEDACQIEPRMMLSGTVYHKDEVVSRKIALNDIVIARGDTKPHVISIYNYVNDAYLNDYRADGIIISTPTGSTGYSLSAGGPIISPAAHLFLMTPLAAHTLQARSVVLPPENRITIRLGAGKDESVERAVCSFDSDRLVPMVTGDRVEICRADKDVLFVKIHNDSFLETLRRKMTDF
ncbi:MAG: NAD(+)/NADH kinase [Eubacteriales bacterium]|nr:NAD(+)/NADH kinase [Eubacteriales bacterium]